MASCDGPIGCTAPPPPNHSHPHLMEQTTSGEARIKLTLVYESTDERPWYWCKDVERTRGTQSINARLGSSEECQTEYVVGDFDPAGNTAWVENGDLFVGMSALAKTKAKNLNNVPHKVGNEAAQVERELDLPWAPAWVLECQACMHLLHRVICQLTSISPWQLL
ncbi:hypothetical protein PIB30_035688 [Stylosanthes scabra]|uniref:Uncharacterized protein n=1 Tax=Stylosanthes scabra TaxID=79078 RepID=A0ABU6UD31_9FABA|nr:hypothetical protein [Stylosanthes scabra]